MQEAVGIADQIQHGSLRWKIRLQLARAYAQAGRANTSIVQKALELVDSVVHDLQGTDLAPIFARSALLQSLKEQLLVTQPRTRSMTSFPAGLTQREVEVLRLVARGATNQQIANALTISPRTVNTHITNILNKTSCENRTAASAFAVKHNLVTT
jgi:DNA-binding NarL/FixJ family response regulator